MGARGEFEAPTPYPQSYLPTHHQNYGKIISFAIAYDYI